MRQMGAPELPGFKPLPGFASGKPASARKPRKRRGGVLSLLIAVSFLAAWGTARPVQAFTGIIVGVFTPGV